MYMRKRAKKMIWLKIWRRPTAVRGDHTTKQQCVNDIAKARRREREDERNEEEESLLVIFRKRGLAP